MWLAMTGKDGFTHANARDVAAAVGVPYLALSTLDTRELAAADLEEWENWPEREDFLIALRHRETTRP